MACIWHALGERRGAAANKAAASTVMRFFPGRAVSKAVSLNRPRVMDSPAGLFLPKAFRNVTSDFGVARQIMALLYPHSTQDLKY